MNPNSSPPGLPIRPEAVLGVVLAGGLGRRMGSPIPKALIEFRRAPMISHVIAVLAPQVGTIVINANSELPSFERFQCRIVEDRITGFAGPLAGLHAAMHACPDFEWYVTCPCDSPFLPADLVERFTSNLAATQSRLTSAICNGQTQPVFAMVHRSLRTSLDTYLKQGGHKIDKWYAEEQYTLTGFPDEQAFLNFNTPDELAAYQQ